MLHEYGQMKLAPGRAGDKGFYLIPGVPELVISKGLVVADTSNLHRYPIVVPFDKDKYVYVNSIDVAGNAVSRMLHVLVARAFVKVPDEHLVLRSTEVVVNHKDGKKANNSPSNLEWCTYSENSLHAYRTGLRDDNVEVRMMNLETSEVFEFYSMQECASFIGYNAGYIARWIRSRIPIGINGKTCLFIRSDQQWPEVEGKGVHVVGTGTRRIVLGIKLDTGKKYQFSSVKSAADYIGYKEGLLSERILRGSKNPVNGFVFDYINVPDPEAEVIQEIRRSEWKRTPRKPAPIILTNLKTGEQTTYSSSEEAAAAWGLSKNTFQCGFNRNQEYRGFKLTYCR